MWLVGPPGSGKTTFEEKLLAAIYGRNGVIRLIDPSEAAVSSGQSLFEPAGHCRA
jgi:adenylate kinase family enzyme